VKGAPEFLNAPRSFEGFFLNMGDTPVKSGDWQTGQKIYANASLAREYAAWGSRFVKCQTIVKG
jgi:hypothetical protein